MVTYLLSGLTQASLLAATAQSAEVSEIKRKLERADEDLVLVNTRLDQAQGIRYILLYACLCPCFVEVQELKCAYLYRWRRLDVDPQG